MRLGAPAPPALLGPAEQIARKINQVGLTPAGHQAKGQAQPAQHHAPGVREPMALQPPPQHGGTQARAGLGRAGGV